MKELKEEAKRQSEAKLRSYGAEKHECGGGSLKRAHGGKVEHPHEEKDKKLAGKIEHEAGELKRDHESKHKRADGGPIAGTNGGGPKLGRGRKGGKKGTNIAIMVGKPGGDSGAPTPPPALGAGPAPAVNLAPKPAMPIGPGGPGIPPGGPGLKHGGKAEKKHGHKEHRH